MSFKQVTSADLSNTDKTILKNVRRVKANRLAYYRSKADAAFWDAQWKKAFSIKTYQKAEQGNLWQFENIFTHYLPKEGRILEAGCGLGQYVLALKVRGYDIEGVDWAPETIRTVNTLYPHLSIRTSDVTQLNVPDESYRGYISLGVVEHSKGGPSPFLKEAWRVLKPEGLAFISVPFFNPLRQLKAKMGLYRGRINGLEFYQYAFTKEEFANLLQLAGFEIVDDMFYDYFKGIGDEIPLIRKIFKLRGIGWRLKYWIKSLRFGRDLGHMVLFVCRKIL